MSRRRTYQLLTVAAAVGALGAALVVAGLLLDGSPDPLRLIGQVLVAGGSAGASVWFWKQARAGEDSQP